MSDEADAAEERMEIGLAYAISLARAATGRVPVATGRCLNCDDIVGAEKRWCGVTCRNEWQKQTGVK